MREVLGVREVEGLSWQELSERFSIPVYTLQYWSRKLNGDVRRGELPRLLPVVVERVCHDSTIGVELSSGVVLRVRPGFDRVHLTLLVQTLQSAC